jgi:glycosyltransferase involved in cell wall biosynthesis
MTTGRVCVLLSTFNGAKYVDEQIQSILNQKEVKATIFVRDDGSSDETVDILKKHEERGNLVLLHSEGNVGVARSFFELLKNSPVDTDYIAFCDQDDVWSESKLIWALDGLESGEHGLPKMYFSKQELVDENLNWLGYSKTPIKVGFGNALLECVTPGCTVVINKSARHLLLENFPRELHMMHDWWMYLVVSCFGRIIYDSRATMKYRQHPTNVVGSSVSSYRLFFVRLRRFLQSGRPIGFIALPSQQAKEFKEAFKGQIPRNNEIILNEFINGKNFLMSRIRIAFSKKIYRQNRVDDILFRLLILLNQY